MKRSSSLLGGWVARREIGRSIGRYYDVAPDGPTTAGQAMVYDANQDRSGGHGERSGVAEAGIFEPHPERFTGQELGARRVRGSGHLFDYFNRSSMCLRISM